MSYHWVRTVLIIVVLLTFYSNNCMAEIIEINRETMFGHVVVPDKDLPELIHRWSQAPLKELPFSAWQGMTFVFVTPKQKESSSVLPTLFSSNGVGGAWQVFGEKNKPLDYARLVGQEGIVDHAERRITEPTIQDLQYSGALYRDMSGNCFYRLLLRMRDSGEIFQWTMSRIENKNDELHQYPLNIRPNDEYVYARTRMLGKQIWSVRLTATLQSESHQSVNCLPPDTRLTVENVEVGTADSPIRLRFRSEDGISGYCDVNLCHGFYGKVSLEPLRPQYNWPDQIWTAIRAGRVELGMSDEQVLFAWGEPISVWRGVESDEGVVVWRYTDSGVVFKNRRVAEVY